MKAPTTCPPQAELSRDTLVSLMRGWGATEAEILNLTAEAAADVAKEARQAPVEDVLVCFMSRHLNVTDPVVYLSVPITTGRAYLEWCAQHRDDQDAEGDEPSVIKKEVGTNNRNKARGAATQLRAMLHGTIIDPSTLADIPDWEQPDYHSFWTKVIARFARKVVFLDEWQYSVGCTTEFAEAVRLGLPTLTERLTPLDTSAGLHLIRAALREYDAAQVSSIDLRRAFVAATRAATQAISPGGVLDVKESAKDEQLIELAKHHNVAQFVSFSPGLAPRVRHSCIQAHSLAPGFDDIRAAVDELLKVASSGAVNIRSFRLGQNQGNPFEYGLTNPDEATSLIRSLAADGYYTIVNETIDTDDGGVSGVILGDVMEFTPLDTPRGVEKPGVTSLPFSLGLDLLETVYGFRPDLHKKTNERLEFSIHPTRVGYRRSHTLLWEMDRINPARLRPAFVWPNRFSRFIGDKAFGLLMAHHLDLTVPATTVVARTVAPFQFGRPTGTAEIWMRTCPVEPRPGLFTTTFGWTDPYELLAREDPEGSMIASVLAQESVEPVYSGASLPGDGHAPDYVEGVAGAGDKFMQGQQLPGRLPPEVVRDVREMAERTREVIGPVRFEFVHDGKQAWVVQLHLSKKHYNAQFISPGEPINGWLDFDPGAGIKELNMLIELARGNGKGIKVTTPVGVTSHVGDLLRRSGVPAMFDLRCV